MPEIPSWLSEATRDGTSSWVREAEETTSAAALTERRLKEANKRLQTIHEDEGTPYVPTTDPRELRVRFEDVARIRKSQIATVLAEIKTSRNVELCFLMDATRSMQPHINGTRDAISQIIEKLTKGKNKVVESLRLAMVAYRDHGDKNPPRFEILNFIDNVDEFKAFCAKLRASGGGDGPEDVFGGLEQAINKVAWENGFATKIIFHMADAPCHGKEFHNNLADDYPKGDPHGLTHTRLFEQLNYKNILYYFGKITKHTNIMIKKFSEAYGRDIEDFDVKDIAAIEVSVAAAVRDSVHVSIARSMAGVSRRHAERKFTYDRDEPDWARVKQVEGVFLTYEMPPSIQSVVDDVPLGRKRPTRGTVKIAPNPFAKGSERVAFYGLDVSKGTEERIVLKEYLREGQNTAIRHEMYNQMQSIAEFLALEFTDKIRGTTGATVNIKFQKIKTLSVGESSHLRFLSCEKCFKSTDKFIRFSNNAEYALLEEDARKLGIDEDYVRLMMAFSHWTYQASNKNLMVVDLEGIVSKTPTGVEVTLTDPAIHCTDMSRFGQMNHGEEGMLNFFRAHDCNNYCIALGLRAEVV